MSTKNVKSASVKDLARGLETTQEVEFQNVEFLNSENPMDHIVDKVTTSSKYNAEREKEIGNGLKSLIEISKIEDADGNKIFPINPLLINLGAWWEVKEARAEVKKLIDAEGLAKGFDKNQYLQEILKSEVDALSDLGEAINRIKYSVTYFKPRTKPNYKIPMKQVRIDDSIYNIAIASFNDAKENQKLTGKKLKQFVIDNGTIMNEIEQL